MTDQDGRSGLAKKLITEKRILLLIVYIALFLDNMLMTTIVPVLPFYLEELRNASSISNSTSFRVNESDIYFNYSNDALDKTFLNESRNETKHLAEADDLADLEESVEIGLLLGSKALMQIITNPIVGPLTSRIGYTIPLFTGFIIIFISTITFAFSGSYVTMLLARATQGVGSACCSSAGLGMLAASYTDPKERGAALSFALGGLALGVLAGFPFGGLVYDLAGKSAPFLILSLIALADGALQLVFLPPKYVKRTAKGSTLFKLLRDPYILLAAVAIVIACLGIAMLETSLPLWLKQMMNTTPSTNGLIFIPTTGFYLIGVHAFGPFGHRIGRWLLSTIGLAMCGTSLLMIPSVRTVYELIIPNVFLGLGVGIFDAVIFPEMGNLVDLRHVGVYGSVYAIADSAVCTAFALGPFVTGPIIKAVGFSALLYIIGGVTLFYAPFLLLLKNPKSRRSEATKPTSDLSLSTIANPNASESPKK